MAGPEIFPPELLVADRKEDVILLLMRLPLAPQRKKELLVQWSQMVGAKFDREDVIRVTGGAVL